MFIPVLLQAEGYAHEMVSRHRPEAGETQIARLVELRIRRQALLRNPQFQLWAVVELDALRTRQVGVQAVRSQIAHIAEKTSGRRICYPPGAAPRHCARR